MRTQKDKDLDAGKPPRELFVGFNHDPLNTSVVYWVPQAWMYPEDAKADFAGPTKVFKYVLVEES